MANEFLSVKNIARQALPRLIENLVFPNLIHKDFSEDFVRGLGTKIQVRKPVILTASEFNQVSGTSAQDVKEESVEVELNKLATVDVEFSSIQMATSVDDLNRLFIEPAVTAIAEKINSDGLELYKDIPYYVGTAGTTPDALSDISDVRKMLNTNKVPTQGRVAVWDTEADAKFTLIEAVVNAEKSGSTKALREGSIGRIMGLENYMSQAVKTHVKGTLAASATKSLQIDEAASATNTIKIGDTASTSAATGKLKKGDILLIGASGSQKPYLVTEDAEVDTGKITVKVTPKCTAAANTAVAVMADHTANLAFNPMAFAFVTRPLITPAGVESYVTSYNGITLRVTRGYDMKYKKDMLSMDVLYGYKTMYPELAVVALG